MLIFVGSSNEAVKSKNSPVTKVCDWIRECGHTPLRWDGIGVFPPGNYVLQRLLELSIDMDAAVFIYDESDTVWYRGDSVTQPRDNVLLELGIFSSRLGVDRTIICRTGKPKIAGDLLGLVYLNLDKANAESWFKTWIWSTCRSPKNPVILDENESLSRAISEIGWEIEGASQNESRVCLFDIINNIVTDKDRLDWQNVSARSFMECVDEEYEFIEDVYWWLIVHGIFRFRDIEQFWAGSDEWFNSVDFAVISERGKSYFLYLQRRKFYQEVTLHKQFGNSKKK